MVPAAPARHEPDEPIFERPHHLRVIGQSPPMVLDAAEQAVRMLLLALCQNPDVHVTARRAGTRLARPYLGAARAARTRRRHPQEFLAGAH